MCALVNKTNSKAVLVTESNLATGVIYRNRNFLTNTKCWHRFVVSNTQNVPRNDVLKAIIDHVYPFDLIPVFYSKDNLNTNSYFMARNCGPAVEKLCKDNLIVGHPYNTSDQQMHKAFKISIMLNYSTTDDIKVDVQKNVTAVLNKRFDRVRKLLDLSKFHEDPELIEFCPLYQPKIMYFVLLISLNLQPEQIILNNNFIKKINPFEVLGGSKLFAVDLSHNLISSLDDLQPLKSLKLKELKLDGNPFCNDYNDEKLYVEGVEEVAPSLEMLDGVLLRQFSFPVARKNFLSDKTSISFDLVNQFLEYYFSVYDARKSELLEGIYHKNALFSMTYKYVPSQRSSHTARLKYSNYSKYSRNLLKFSDFSRNSEFLFKGKQEIVDLFSKLPDTKHDCLSFVVDLIHKTETLAVICVSGVFCEVKSSLVDKERRLLGFNRTFALEMKNETSCVIVNEQLHVYNALTCQETAFIDTKSPRVKSAPKISTVKDQETFIETVVEITSLKKDWAKKCLEECEYNMKATLDLFLSLYKADKIPQDAFCGV